MAGRRTAGATDVRALADDLGAALLSAVRQGSADESPAAISRSSPRCVFRPLLAGPSVGSGGGVLDDLFDGRAPGRVVGQGQGPVQVLP
jgi:hypothetical protein